MEKTGFFEVAPGNKSSTRLMTFLALISGLIIALSSVFMDGVTLGDSLPMVLVLLAYSLGGKAFQNVVEMQQRKALK